jgi:hypothetical protein
MKNVHSLTSWGVLLVRWSMLLACGLAASDLMAQNQVASLDAGKKIVKPKSPAELNHKSTRAVTDTQAIEVVLNAVELLIAERVEVGMVKCELGNSVEVVADPKKPGYFDVHGKKFHFRMAPVVTTTGAIRLEDQKAGAVWLQLANKSMLMSQKFGSRLADACVTPAQALVVAAMEKSPPPNLLEVDKVVAPTALNPTVVPSMPITQ